MQSTELIVRIVMVALVVALIILRAMGMRRYFGCLLP